GVQPGAQADLVLHREGNALTLSAVPQCRVVNLDQTAHFRLLRPSRIGPAMMRCRRRGGQGCDGNGSAVCPGCRMKPGPTGSVEGLPMKPAVIVGIILIVLGGVALAHPGHTSPHR